MLKDRAVLLTRIRQDIQRRNLAPGDRYLTTRAAAELFDVSPMTAGRALQELARQGLLDRKPGAGTVLKAAPTTAPAELRQIHIVTPESLGRENMAPYGTIMEGIHRILPFDTVQLTFVPPTDQVAFLRRLMNLDDGTHERTGFVLILCRPDTLSRFAEAGVPTVVAGSTYEHAHRLPYVNRDGAAAGRMLARYVIEQGHERIAVLMPESWNYGDGEYLDGVLSAAREMGLGADAVTVRTAPPEPALVASVLASLRASASEPTGFLCHSAPLARLVRDALAPSRSGRPSRYLVGMPDTEGCPDGCACVRYDLGAQDFGECLGRLLSDVLEGRKPEIDHFLAKPVAVEMKPAATHRKVSRTSA